MLRLKVTLLTICFCLLAAVSLAQERIAQTEGPCIIRSVALKSLPQTDVILIQADGPIESWHDFVLRSPERIAVDLEGCEYQGSLRPERRDGRFIRLLRASGHGNKMRVAANIREGVDIQRYIRKNGDGLAIYISQPRITFIEEIIIFMYSKNSGWAGADAVRCPDKNIRA